MEMKKWMLILLCLCLFLSVKSVEAKTIEIENVNITNQILKKDYNLGVVSSERELRCSELIDTETRQLIRDVLKYPRYIVPAIVITLGTLDMFKAVTAGKEDEMKKAQRTLVKRVIIGVCVFLVPILIDVLIWLTNIAWEGVTPCAI